MLQVEVLHSIIIVWLVLLLLMLLLLLQRQLFLLRVVPLLCNHWVLLLLQIRRLCSKKSRVGGLPGLQGLRGTTSHRE